MRPESQSKLQRIKKVSSIFRWICRGALAPVALVGLGGVVSVLFGLGGIDRNGFIYRTDHLPISYRLILSVVTVVTFASLYKMFYHLQQLFGTYSRGETFTRESVSQLRQFGIACLLWGVMKFVWVLSLELSVHPAHTFSENGDSFLLGWVIIAIAWFMDMAVDLREENELTI